MYHNFLIHSSADGHLGCFHVLAMTNSAVMNIGVHVSLSDLVSLVCMRRSGIAGSYGSSISTFLRDLHTDFPLSTGRFFKDQTWHWSVMASLCNHLSWIWECLILTALLSKDGIYDCKITTNRENKDEITPSDITIQYLDQKINKFCTVWKKKTSDWWHHTLCTYENTPTACITP